ncbi:hypothetical protein NPN18_25615, partial [Vibrio parahaemolyticus]|nr:hypothetical protein [Vibrio parahaemolyticus]
FLKPNERALVLMMTWLYRRVGLATTRDAAFVFMVTYTSRPVGPFKRRRLALVGLPGDTARLYLN